MDMEGEGDLELFLMYRVLKLLRLGEGDLELRVRCIVYLWIFFSFSSNLSYYS